MDQNQTEREVFAKKLLEQAFDEKNLRAMVMSHIRTALFNRLMVEARGIVAAIVEESITQTQVEVDAMIEARHADGENPHIKGFEVLVKYAIDKLPEQLAEENKKG